VWVAKVTHSIKKENNVTKISLQDVTSTRNEQSFLGTTNNNYAVIESKSDTFLSRDGTAPNYMLRDFDMNGHRILNLPAPGSLSEPVRLSDIANGAVLTVSTAQIPHFPSKAFAQITSVSAAISYLYTAGYATPDDNGGGFYIKVGGVPSHAGYIQTADGAFWELSQNQTITPEQFGAIGDGSMSGSWSGTDNTQAFKNLAAYLNVKKSVKEVKFGANKVYLVWPNAPANQELLFELVSTDGLTFDFNGSDIIAKGALPGGQQSYVFYLRSCLGTTFKGASLYHKAFIDLANPVFDRGIVWFTLEDNCIGTTFHDLNIVGGRIGMQSTRTTTSNRCRNVKVFGAYFNKVFYGINFQKTGDDLFVRNFIDENGGRAYFCYNVFRHDVQIKLISYGNIVPDIPLSVVLDPAETNAILNTLSDINLDVTVVAAGQTLVGGAAFLDLAIANSDSGQIATIRNIKVKLTIDVPSLTISGGRILQTAKTKTDLTADNVARGHNIENIDISGCIHANGNDCVGIELFKDSNWSGENVRNIKIHDMWMDGFVEEAVIIDCACLTKSGLHGTLILENLGFVGQTVASPRGYITLTNSAPGAVYMYNVSSPNFSTSATITPTWLQNGGTNPVLGNGSIAGYYQRSGNKVTLTINLTTGSTTTYGDGSTNYRFTIPAPYNKAPIFSGVVGSALCFAGATTFFTGTVLALNDGSGGVTLNIANNLTGVNWSKTVPATWQSGNFLNLTVTYDV
jgi:hypothetical protein